MGCYLEVALSAMTMFFAYKMASYYPTNIEFEIISRDEWRAKLPKNMNYIENPVPYVIIHSTFKPCNSTKECIKTMQWIQNYRFESGKMDFPYNFAVGGDGKAYEGTGWSRIGEHVGIPSYNRKSIGIGIIGGWMNERPPDNLLDTVKKLILYGVKKEKISENYTLYAHETLEPHEPFKNYSYCPGKALFEALATWPHFSSVP